ncbi:MarR family winged helix-turn-helix transcriptional regulator [Streptomyces varsoviensis]|uniref:MarR family winged helix-turn-helix transcriptional regulator n=1 Tax=Streptomyces varsoviensis TaxID=67373 RepID=UPI000662A75E|nr:MarR family winged helix-turn-helix transcriptional regulator [Streptomyces varsoviensis]
MPRTPSSVETVSDAHEGRLEYALWQVNRTLLKALDDELNPLGLTMSQFGTLNRLAVHGPRCTADLARDAGMRPQTVAQSLAPLLKAGHVRRRGHPVHKRVQLIELTDQGRRVWEDADRRAAAVERRIQEALGERCHQTMCRDAWKIVDAFGGTADEAAGGPH